MFTDIEQIPCSVTIELVEEISHTNPSVFRPNGQLDEIAVLYYLGFTVDPTSKVNYRGVNINFDVYVRDYRNPDKVYVTTVYNGRLRREHKYRDGQLVTHKGRPVYSHKWHRLYDHYVACEVLQPSDMDKYVESSRLIDILEVGDIISYNGATSGKKDVKNNLSTQKELSKEEMITQLAEKYSWAEDYIPANGDIRQKRAADKMFSDSDQEEGYLSDMDDIHGNISQG